LRHRQIVRAWGLAQIGRSRRPRTAGLYHFGDFDLHGKPFALAFAMNGEEWAAIDQHCVTPGCTCDDVVLCFTRIESGREVQEPLFDVRLSLSSEDPPRIAENDAPLTQEQERVLEALKAELVDWRRELRLRRRLLREIAATRLAEPEGVSRHLVKVGRNEPCPCGSGRSTSGAAERPDRSPLASRTHPQGTAFDRWPTAGAVRAAGARARRGAARGRDAPRGRRRASARARRPSGQGGRAGSARLRRSRRGRGQRGPPPRRPRPTTAPQAGSCSTSRSAPVPPLPAPDPEEPDPGRPLACQTRPYRRSGALASARTVRAAILRTSSSSGPTSRRKQMTDRKRDARRS